MKATHFLIGRSFLLVICYGKLSMIPCVSPNIDRKSRDRVQRSQLVLSGEADMDAICTELKSKAKCSGFGAVISQGDVDAILGPEIRKLEPLRTILNMPRMLGKQNGIREFDLENLHYPQGSPS